MITRLVGLFKETFSRDSILAWARECKALVRLRNIHPADLCSALVGCAMGDEERTIATARRLYDRIAGYMPEESSFYERFNNGLAGLMKHMFEQCLRASTKEQQAAVAVALGGTNILDVLAIDASQISLPAAAAETLPSTHDEHGGLKLTATLSLMYQRLERVSITAARTHDRKALRLSRWLNNQLILFDRGYSDFKLWASIEDRRGFFLTPLKSTAKPAIAKIREGLGQPHVGRRLNDGPLPCRNVVDLDAAFSVGGQKKRIFRVIRVKVPHRLPGGKVEIVEIWLVTNLSAADFSAEQIATLYRLRWEVETLFRVLKSVGRLDHLRSANPDVIHAFLYATLIGLVLAQQICGYMRQVEPEAEPSIFRVTALVLGYLPLLVAAIGSRKLHELLERLQRALWREGLNPNPGRAYKLTHYSREIAAC